MTSTKDSGLGNGSSGRPQTSMDEGVYPKKQNQNENKDTSPSKYAPTSKHDPSSGYGSPNPIKSYQEGQHLLDTGIKDGKQIYNITNDGIIVKFQPDNTPNNGFHVYTVSKPRDIPSTVLKKLVIDGKISKSDYTRLRKGKKG